MGTFYSACYVGVRVTREEFEKAVWRSVTHRGCTCMIANLRGYYPDAKYCPVCGVSLQLEKHPIKQYNQALRSLAGYGVVHPKGAYKAYVYIVEHVIEPNLVFLRLDQHMRDTLQDLRDAMCEALYPLGLWTETFGVHNVSYVEPDVRVKPLEDTVFKYDACATPKEE